MDRDVTLYQITSVMAERVFQKIDNFNKGRREDAGACFSVFAELQCPAESEG